MIRLLELDFLRGVAVLMVVFFHYTTKYYEIFNDDTSLGFEFKYGFYGVQLFFILSGFVIFMTVNRVKSGIEFVKKRFIRLYPTFWLGVLITFLVTSVAGHERFERTFGEFFANLTMTPDLLGARFVDGVYWSLLIELIFYGIIWFLLVTKLIKHIERVLVLWLMISVLIHFFVDSNFFSLIFLVSYGYLFIAGISFFNIWNKKRVKLNILIVLLSLLYSYFVKGCEEGTFTLVFMTFISLFVANKLAVFSRFKFLIFIGQISYPLYLIHQFLGLLIINFLIQKLGLQLWLSIMITLSLMIGVSWVIVEWFEGRIVKKIRNSEFFKKI